jgi:hypothetical protein
MITPPESTSAVALADWIEFSVSVDNPVFLRSSVKVPEEEYTSQEEQEALVGNIWLELERRKRLYDPPPFTVTPSSVKRGKLGKSAVYQFCLMLSLYGVIEKDSKSPRLFERITLEATKRYLGGNALVIGWPEGGVLDETKMGKIAGQLGERFIVAPQSNHKDRGVDVIAWAPFADRRGGQVAILVQSAAGKNWNSKAGAPVDAWCEYIHWDCRPIRAFAVPSILTKDEWHDKSVDKGLFLDRIRIFNLLAGARIPKSLQSGILSQVSSSIKKARKR